MERPRGTDNNRLAFFQQNPQASFLDRRLKTADDDRSRFTKFPRGFLGGDHDAVRAFGRTEHADFAPLENFRITD
ncbi:MAG TPA: hypothetical protein VNO43_13370 [Candidatus Eisenbacteria bacterium]|nr:hypothetical protein [Candidatus Eisenbacteria bacterium]